MKLDLSSDPCYNRGVRLIPYTLLNNVVVGKEKTMKSSKTAPAWAINLVTQVCSDYKRALPKQFQWYQSRDRKIHEYTIKASVKSSGHAGFGKIHVSAGSDEQDQRLVLLHELAHHITQKRQTVKRRYAYRPRNKRVFEAHSIRFWRLAVELYERYDMDMDYAFNREKGYKIKATQAFQEKEKAAVTA
jgi:hypothetical protein